MGDSVIAHQIFYKGRVQGVGFRYSVKQIATGYDIFGYVKNLPDGRVECWLQGDEAEVEDMEKEILKSHLKGFIREVTCLEVTVDAEMEGFHISK